MNQYDIDKALVENIELYCQVGAEKLPYLINKNIIHKYFPNAETKTLRVKDSRMSEEAKRVFGMQELYIEFNFTNAARIGRAMNTRTITLSPSIIFTDGHGKAIPVQFHFAHPLGKYFSCAASLFKGVFANFPNKSKCLDTSPTNIPTVNTYFNSLINIFKYIDTDRLLSFLLVNRDFFRLLGITQQFLLVSTYAKPQSKNKYLSFSVISFLQDNNINSNHNRLAKFCDQSDTLHIGLNLIQIKRYLEYVCLIKGHPTIKRFENILKNDIVKNPQVLSIVHCTDSLLPELNRSLAGIPVEDSERFCKEINFLDPLEVPKQMTSNMMDDNKKGLVAIKSVMDKLDPFKKLVDSKFDKDINFHFFLNEVTLNKLGQSTDRSYMVARLDKEKSIPSFHKPTDKYFELLQIFNKKIFNAFITAGHHIDDVNLGAGVVIVPNTKYEYPMQNGTAMDFEFYPAVCMGSDKVSFLVDSQMVEMSTTDILNNHLIFLSTGKKVKNPEFFPELFISERTYAAMFLPDDSTLDTVNCIKQRFNSISIDCISESGKLKEIVTITSDLKVEIPVNRSSGSWLIA